MYRSLIKKMVDPLVKKVQLMLGRCVLSAAEGRGLLVLQVEALEGETMEEAERMENYGLAGHPPGGSEGAFMSIGGARDHVLVVAMEHRGFRPDIKDGEVKVYSIYDQFIHLDDEGFMVFEAPKGFKFKGEIFEANIDKGISFNGETFDAALSDSISFEGSNLRAEVSGEIGMKAEYFGVAAEGGSHIEGGLRATRNIETEQNLVAEDQVRDHKSTMQDMRNTYNSHTHPQTSPVNEKM